MAYCTPDELVGLTGSTRDDAFLTAIIAEADRQVTSYLRTRGVGANICDETKSASLALSQAGLLLFGLQEGSLQASSGDFSSSLNVMDAVTILEKRAWRILDEYVSRQIALTVPRKQHMAKVCGGCH